VDGRPRNPAGPNFGKRTTKPPYSGIGKNDYAANSPTSSRPGEGRAVLLLVRRHGAHRGYEKGSGLKAGKRLETPCPRRSCRHAGGARDILDYCVEIEWFDAHSGGC